jgi:type I restriction enzyme S subunit
MIFPSKKLEDIFVVSGGEKAGNNDFPVLSITMSNGLVDQSEKFKKRIASKDTAKYRVAFRNELVVGFPIDEGVLGFQTKYDAGIVSPAYGIWKLIKPDEVYVPYLESYLRSPQARHLYSTKMRGAVARRRSLTKKDFLNLEVPFPERNQQIRIVQVLNRVEALVIQKKVEIHELNSLMNSIFFEVFGDPTLNEKGWCKKPLGKVLTNIDSGWSPRCETIPAKHDEWGVLKLGAVSQGEFKAEENKAMLPGMEPKVQHEVKVGDLLFARKNTYELVAATAYVSETRAQLLMPDLIFRLVIEDKNEVDPIFLWKLLSYPSQRKEIQSLAAGAAGSMPNISKAKLLTAEIPVPDIEIQHKFIDIVNKVESIKKYYLTSLKDLEELYGSIRQKAFKGELDLSKVLLQESVDSENIITDENNDVSIEDHTKRDPAVSEAVSSKESLNSLLVNYIQELDGKYFSLDDYWQRYGAIEQENDEIIGIDNYEALKEDIFTLINRGELEQVFDKEKKQLLLRTPA